jgi:hypothetical protein
VTARWAREAPQAAFNFPNAPEPDVQFPVSLASALSGQQLGTTAEMRIRFNSRRGGTRLLAYVPADGLHSGTAWAISQEETGGGYPFLPLVLHEIGHGLGIQLYASRQTGEYLGHPTTTGWGLQVYLQPHPGEELA